MNLSKYLYAISIAIVISILCKPSFADQEQEKPWIGTLGDGTKINDEDLKKIVSDHEKWLNDHKRGNKANLKGANLQGVHLEESNLQGAELYKRRGTDSCNITQHKKLNATYCLFIQLDKDTTGKRKLLLIEARKRCLRDRLACFCPRPLK